MTLIRIIKEWVSPLSINERKVTYIKVTKTKTQRRKQMLLTLAILFISQITLAFVISMLRYFSQENADFVPVSIAVCLISIEVLTILTWIILHSLYSPIEKWRVSTLLKGFAEENDILRKHKSDIDSTQSIRWEYYLNSGMIFIKLFQGGHVSKASSEEIPNALLSYFIKETRESWFLEQYLIGDGFVKMVFSHKPDKSLYIKGYEDFIESKDLNIKLTKRLSWTLKQPMGLIVGPTSSGKTSLLKYLILAYLINNPKIQYIRLMVKEHT